MQTRKRCPYLKWFALSLTIPALILSLSLQAKAQELTEFFDDDDDHETTFTVGGIEFEIIIAEEDNVPVSATTDISGDRQLFANRD